MSTATPIFPGEVFADTAAFDEGIRLLLPYYDEMLTAVVRGVPATATHILELGCGTGELSQRLLAHCPQAHLTALDYSPRMVTATQAKLQAHGYGDRFTCVEADFGDWALGQLNLPHTSFDACVSSLAIHHLNHAMKQQLFQAVYRSLAPNGWFWNADPTLATHPDLTAVYQSAREAWTASHSDTTLEAVRAQMGTSDRQGHSSQDQLATLADQLQWLQAAGFATTEILWKYYGITVYGAQKAVSNARA